MVRHLGLCPVSSALLNQINRRELMYQNINLYDIC